MTNNKSTQEMISALNIAIGCVMCSYMDNESKTNVIATLRVVSSVIEDDEDDK